MCQDTGRNAQIQHLRITIQEHSGLSEKGLQNAAAGAIWYHGGRYGGV
jgi:hypothetical protein